jgi:hypothetical protein
MHVKKFSDNTAQDHARDKLIIIIIIIIIIIN